MNFSIVLRHPNGERKTVMVEFVSVNASYVTFRWDLAGLYDLNLAVNVMTPRSAQAQSKGKAKWHKKDKPLWRAEDIAGVRRLAAAYLAEKRGNPQEAADAAIKRHIASVTNPRIAVVDDIVRQLTDHERAEAIANDGFEPFPQYTGDPDVEGETG